MAVAEVKPLMTTAEFLALPDDGVERWLHRGVLREKLPRSTGHRLDGRINWAHGRVMTRVAKFLDNWLDQQPKPRGQILCGGVGIRPRLDPERTVGVDVAYISAELAVVASDETTLVDGVPILAVEITSPSDTVEEINDKVDEYLDAGVKLVWVIDPRRQIVLICRPGKYTESANPGQQLTAEPELPGFRVSVAELFA